MEVAVSHLPEGTSEGNADSRIYRRLFTINNLHLAKKWWSLRGIDRAQIQVLVLRRLLQVALKEGTILKSIKSSKIDAMIPKVQAALAEVRKFENFLQGRVWPKTVQDLREVILNSTTFDGAVEANRNNGTVLLPILAEKYKKAEPAGSLLKDKEDGGNTEDGEDKEDEGEPTPEEPEGQPPQSQEGIGGSIGTEEADKVLRNLGLDIIKSTWEQYEEVNCSKGINYSHKFDMLLTEVPVLEEAAKKAFADFVVKHVTPMAYCILFIQPEYFTEWKTALGEKSFTCMSHLFTCMKDHAAAEKGKSKHFPVNVSEFAVIARAPANSGLLRNNFTPDFLAKIDGTYSRCKRYCAGLTDVPKHSCVKKGGRSRKRIWASEKNPSMLEQLIRTYSPQGASILDPYGRTLSTMTACYLAGRKCTAIEPDEDCVTHGRARLLTKIEEGLVSVNTQRRNPVRARRTSSRHSEASANMLQAEGHSSTASTGMPCNINEAPGSPVTTTSEEPEARMNPPKKRKVIQEDAAEVVVGGPEWVKTHGDEYCAIRVCTLLSREGCTGHKCQTCKAGFHTPCASTERGFSVETRADYFCTFCWEKKK